MRDESAAKQIRIRSFHTGRRRREETFRRRPQASMQAGWGTQAEAHSCGAWDKTPPILAVSEGMRDQAMT